VKENASSFGKSRLRLLSAEEIALWLAVAKTVSPRPARRLPEAPAAPAPEGGPAKQPDPSRPANPPGKARPTPPASAHKPPPLEPLERRLRQKLARGRIAPDAVFDLHGLSRQDAHVAMRQFLSQAQRNGAKLVLVVTGKGGRGAAQAEGRTEDEAAGVLRRSVPQWLRGPDYHSIVVGFEEASRPHGGAGALYVRIRRPRAIPE
jgi:DNA-nicking Smr family endonuclease